MGGGQDTPFEQAFANLAHTHLKDKAPSLLDYEVGFQLVDRNEDNTKAVGIFGFKVGNQWLYAPVFFLNGELKGHELLYIKNQDSFVPLKENWLSYLLNRKPSVLGEETDKNLSHIGIIPPHLYQLSRSPHKFASAIPRMSDWAQQVMPDIATFATENPLTSEKYKNIRTATQFIKDAGANVAITFIRAIQENPQLEKVCYDVYGKDEVIAAVKEARDSLKKSASVLNVKKAAVQPRTIKQVLNVDPLYKMAQVQKKIRILKLSEDKKAPDGLDQGLSGLDDKEKEQIVRSGVVIKDTRGPEETTLAYRTEGPEKLTNPFASGIYDVLTSPGKFERCYIVFGPYSSRRRNSFCTLFRLEGSKSVLNTHPSNIWVSNKVEDKEFDAWWDSLEDVKSLSKSSAKYILITKTGEGTVPFRVESEVADEDGYKTYNVYFDDYARKCRAGYLPKIGPDSDRRFGFEGSGYDDEYSSNYPRITLTERHGGRIRLMKGELFVPNGTKVIKVTDEESDKSEKDEPLTLASLIDIQMKIINKSPKLMIQKMGSGFILNGKPQRDKIDSIIYLIRQHGLGEKQASLLLDEAYENGKASYVLKYAAPWDLLNQGPTAPSDPGPFMGYDPMTSGGVPTQFASEYMQNIPEMSAANTDRSIYAPMGPEPKYQSPSKPDQSTLQAAMQASQTGQKEVFDTAMLGSLLKATKDENLVDRYLGDLMKGIDRLGRILFMFYWHQEEFEGRYGKDDLVELEDGLRNAFEALGDITLFLKQKTIDPGQDNAYGPDIEDISSI